MDADTTLELLGLRVYPIKGCAGIAMPACRVDAFGLAGDRRWMLVDAAGEFLSQRELPRLALVRPEWAHAGAEAGTGTGADPDAGLVARAPGLPPLRVVPRDGARTTVWCWSDRCSAIDEGDEAAGWFSEHLGRPVRLVRFDDARPRPSEARWAGARANAPGGWSRFSDGYPVLLLSQASVDGLGARLAAAGRRPVGIERFRPNVIVSAAHPHEEDALASLTDGTVELVPVKPCARCEVTEVDPASGQAQPPGSVLDALAAYRREPRLGGGLAFGQNCVVAAGIGATLRVGATLRGTYDFGR